MVDGILNEIQIKPGYKTSEFYLSIALSLIGIAVTLGYITPEQASTLTDQAKVFVDGITMIIGAVLTIIPVLAYLVSRIKLKIETAKSNALRAGLPTVPNTTKQSIATMKSALPSSKPSYIVQ